MSISNILSSDSTDDAPQGTRSSAYHKTRDSAVVTQDEMKALDNTDPHVVPPAPMIGPDSAIHRLARPQRLVRVAMPPEPLKINELKATATQVLGMPRPPSSSGSGATYHKVLEDGFHSIEVLMQGRSFPPTFQSYPPGQSSAKHGYLSIREDGLLLLGDWQPKEVAKDGMRFYLGVNWLPVRTVPGNQNLMAQEFEWKESIEMADWYETFLEYNPKDTSNAGVFLEELMKIWPEAEFDWVAKVKTLGLAIETSDT
ncbi:hypothetical protein CAC42_2705 [Sphaceloma murrayae]|uniref:Uncharacterized protein n=1 Tax=Sphaceloma murrayae TaxID=2082308 RepID=A0A2K1R0E3_9PEZI|nr:hypothetical protein CAC42_2705 [Sphaceloma murrayae]